MAAKNFASTRFSELTEITTDNVKELKVAFTFATGVNKGQEAAPLVVDGTMYIVSPYPNILYALDLTKPGAPLKWKYEPKPEPAVQGVACYDVVNRGAAYANGWLFQHARQQHDRDRGVDRQGDLARQARQHQPRRDDGRHRSGPIMPLPWL
jgi:glucose dehydrogenase